MLVAVWERHKSLGDLFLECFKSFQRLLVFWTGWSHMTRDLAYVQLSDLIMV